MATPLLCRPIVCCSKQAIRQASRQAIQDQRRNIRLQLGPVEKLELPPDLPPQFYSQIPKRMRPDHIKREIKIHPNPPSERLRCKLPFDLIDTQQLALLDPTGARSRLFTQSNADGAKPGDVLLVTFATGEPFSGVALSIKYRGPHSSVLLRNEVTRIGTEMDVKVFSPLVRSIEVAQRAEVTLGKRPKRAKLFYLRKPEKDIGSVQKVVDGYLRQRATLIGGGREAGTKGERAGKSRVRGQKGR